jgi:hypothetical protein
MTMRIALNFSGEPIQNNLEENHAGSRRSAQSNA